MADSRPWQAVVTTTTPATAGLPMKSLAEKCFEENIAYQPVEVTGRPKDPQAYNLNLGLLEIAKAQVKLARAQEQLASNMSHLSQQIAQLAQRSR